MQILICDDESAELETMKRAVEHYAQKHPELKLETECFRNSFELLQYMEQNGTPDIALLDICMPGVLGTEIAWDLRSRQENGTDIIFLSTSSEYAVEAFSLHASDYLKKPYTEEQLMESLDRVIEKRLARGYVPIQCGKETKRVPMESIMYAEIERGNVEIHLKDGQILKSRTTFSKFADQFRNVEGFMLVGASILVNFRCVQRIQGEAMELTNGVQIPIPRRLRSEVKKAYFEFYMGEAMDIDI